MFSRHCVWVRGASGLVEHFCMVIAFGERKGVDESFKVRVLRVLPIRFTQFSFMLVLTFLGVGDVVMREEIVTGMQLMGVTKLEDLKPEMVRYVGVPMEPPSLRPLVRSRL